MLYCTTYRGILADVDVYNTKTQTWRVSNSMLTSRRGHRMYVLMAKLTVFGSSGGLGMKSIEEYNGETWNLVNTTLENEHGFSASVLVPCI